MNQSSSNIFVNSLKAIIKSAFKIFFIAFAWILRLIGTTLSKLGEAIERILIKRSSL